VLRRHVGSQLDADVVAAFVGYYRGRRTVVWSAFATATPQRLFAWLGSVSPGISAGVAGATALAIGVASPPPPIVTPAAAAQRQASKRPDVADRAPARVRPVLGDNPGVSALRATRRSGSQGSKPRRVKRRKPVHRHTPATKRGRAAPRAVAPGSATPGTPARPARPVRPQPAKPVKPVKPQTVRPARPPTAQPDKVQPAKPPTAQPDKVQPVKVAPPTGQPPVVTLPQAAVPHVEMPKLKPAKE
jgi:hypothetical protein